jgi:hypothetical protein
MSKAWSGSGHDVHSNIDLGMTTKRTRQQSLCAS